MEIEQNFQGSQNNLQFPSYTTLDNNNFMNQKQVYSNNSLETTQPVDEQSQYLFNFLKSIDHQKRQQQQEQEQPCQKLEYYEQQLDQQEQQQQLQQRNQESYFDNNAWQNLIRDSQKSKNLTATVVELKKPADSQLKQQREIVQNFVQCKAVYFSPQKYINIETNYRLYDDIFLSEFKLLQMAKANNQNFYDANDDSEENQQDPSHSFKFIQSANKNDQLGIITIYLSDRSNCNSPPAEYIVQRFESFNNDIFFNLGQRIKKYLEFKKKIQQQLSQGINLVQYNAQQRDDINNEVLKELGPSLIYMGQMKINQNGEYKVETGHVSLKLMAYFGQDPKDAVMTIMKNGLKTFRTQKESIQRTLEKFDDLEIFNDLTQMDTEPIVNCRNMEIQRKNGTTQAIKIKVMKFKRKGLIYNAICFDQIPQQQSQQIKAKQQQQMSNNLNKDYYSENVSTSASESEYYRNQQQQQ